MVSCGDQCCVLFASSTPAFGAESVVIVGGGAGVGVELQRAAEQQEQEQRAAEQQTSLARQEHSSYPALNSGLGTGRDPFFLYGILSVIKT